MRGPEKDAIAVRTNGEIKLEITPRKIRPKGSFATWPLIRGTVNFFDSQVVGVKALMHSADLSPEMAEEEPSKFDLWLEKKLGNESFQKFILGFSVFLGPTGGYLWGYFLCAGITSLLCRKKGRAFPLCALGAFLGAVIACLCGAAHYAVISRISFSASLAVCLIPFLPMEAVKAVLAVFLGRSIRRALDKQ